MSVEEFRKWLEGMIEGQPEHLRELLLRVKIQADKIQIPLSVNEHLKGIQYTG
jgi:hypothetical protein